MGRRWDLVEGDIVRIPNIDIGKTHITFQKDTLLLKDLVSLSKLIINLMEVDADIEEDSIVSSDLDVLYFYVIGHKDDYVTYLEDGTRKRIASLALSVDHRCKYMVILEDKSIRKDLFIQLIAEIAKDLSPVYKIEETNYHLGDCRIKLNKIYDDINKIFKKKGEL